MKKVLLMLAFALTLAGCQTLNTATSNELVVQYATMKLIEESDYVTSAGVSDTVAKVRLFLDGGDVVTLDEFSVLTTEYINDRYTLQPSDKFIILAIISQVQTTIQSEYELDVINDDVEYRIRDFLDQVELAAKLSGV
jgi:uncharacterized protein YceK